MRDQVVEFLSRQLYGVVSSISNDGSPESALVGVAWWLPTAGVPELIFDTTSETRKAKNLSRDPRCAIVIGWEDETTVQLQGICRRLTGSEMEHAKPSYFRTWPECRAHESWPNVAYFSVRPNWLRYSCYLQGALRLEFDEHELISGLQNSAAGLCH